ncbi:MAG: hypothetical protein RI513_05300 [Balneolaceae bacterium]|nr:hypothetical protein [Balneolaceae bacterium]MDR9446945.1 hypothetical protein [Balneolaceae bacterium]
MSKEINPSFDAITTLEPAHLDHPMFMKQFATEMRTGLQGKRLLVLHGDSSFTEETIQQGIPREEAANQTARQLNRRLVALLADEGVSALGITLAQRGFTTYDETMDPPFWVNESAWRRLPAIPVICCATLVAKPAQDGTNVHDTQSEHPRAQDTHSPTTSLLLAPFLCQRVLQQALAIPSVKPLRAPDAPALDPASATVFAT